MTREQYEEMMEFVQEDINTITDYLEVNYDDLTLEDICMLYRVFLEEDAEAEDKEDIHRDLLEQLYDMAEEHPKEMLKAAKKVQNYLEK
ncbi:MAG: hypothetical protein J6K15_07100 [Lachnospiraceae bacterium]|nr:hypothetical protein [Lachnospiraceae bacterium]MBP3577861.1 hypothetical protein [Lachnospiraceae bacterium]